jgi:hypothetical protein
MNMLVVGGFYVYVNMPLVLVYMNVLETAALVCVHVRT